MRGLLLIVVFSAIAGTGSFTLGDHGHGFGHGYGGGWGHASYSRVGGYAGFYGRGGFGSARFYSGRYYGWPYRHSVWPYGYRYFGFPYAYGYVGYPYSYYSYPTVYYGYPAYCGYPAAGYGYPSGYYASDGDYSYGEAVPPQQGGAALPQQGDTPAPQQYVASRPVSDVAQLQVKLPDPQGTIWVEGEEINSSGTLRQFNSPPLDPSQRYTYTVKAEWHDNGKVASEERKVYVRANAFTVVDFNQPSQVVSDANRPALPELPPPQPRPGG
jgi:uncharacterized protein (TIGR03000 family)